MDDCTAFGHLDFLPAAGPAYDPVCGGPADLATGESPLPPGTPGVDAFAFGCETLAPAGPDAVPAGSGADPSDPPGDWQTAGEGPVEFSAPPAPAGTGWDSGQDAPPEAGPGRGGGSRRPRVHRRRRHRAARSAVVTLAVPSAAMMGVAAVAVAGVAATHSTADRPPAASGRAPVRSGPGAAAILTGRASGPAWLDDDRQRAERLRQKTAERRPAERQERREWSRPRFALPVDEHGLSAYFGQVGFNWMSFHTGIDFPVDVGTPVRAATDGRVSTAWSPAYGNMVKVTARDGTQTWYCHLSRTRIRSGTVQAGQVIAYSGNTGNTTGPHLHFEVRPNGGAPVDPLPWLLGHDLDPR